MNIQTQTNQIEVFQSNLGFNLQRLEVKKELSNIDAMIVNAVASSPMLLNIPEEQAEDILRKTLAKIGLVCGIKTPPTDIETSILINFLRKHYRTMTVAELETAFELNMIGELGDRIHHFHNLNIDFVTAVVNQFKYTRKLQAFKAYRIAEINVDKQTKTDTMTNEEAFNALVELTKELKRAPDFFAFGKAYQHFKDAGLETRSLEEMKAFKEEVRKDLSRQKKNNLLQASSTIERRRIEDDFNEDKLKSECQRRTLVEYLEKILDSEQAGTLFEQKK